ncbi:MAG: M4 family metallopeptidase [Lachnospiraceae bacterium]|nr:M4 family metallopeptidase [Lachnospiraceae bacterium]
MKKILKKILCTAITLSLLISAGCGEAAAVVSYDSYQLTPNRYYGPDGDLGSDTSGDIPEGAQLTEADIQKMNGGKARFVYGNDGYVSFINGRFSNIEIKDEEDCIRAIQPIAKLIGLGAGSEFFANHGSRDARGYTYYTFQQRYGEDTVLYAAMTVIVDPEGYAAGLSSSFTPNIGIAQETVDVGPDKALEILKANITTELTYYPEYTHKIAITLFGKTYNVYAIYSNNPFTTGQEFDMRYYEFFVTTDGKFISDVFYPVASIGTGNYDAMRNDDYFKNLSSQDVSFKVTKWDGSKETITVPVSYNSANGLWYLGDANRKIIFGEYGPLMNEGKTELLTSKNGTDWRNQDLLAYDRYIKAYDFYAKLGLKSVDGTELPIILLRGLPEDNACYSGIHNGWACFCTSDLNTYSEAMDVVGHEFTHGITSNSMITNKYLGITGAINEAYSDIMGNIIEMRYGMTGDTTWLIGENSGRKLRSMSSPRDYEQPISTQDSYYFDPTNLQVDGGGVHVNSSLLNMMAYKLYEAGMTLEEETSLWLTTIDIITPLSEYAEILEILLLSIDINGFDQSYKQVLIDAFRNAGMINY